MRVTLVLALLAAFAAAPVARAKPHAAPLTDAQAEAALMSKHLVAIGGGRRMNMVCIGHGSPTVVFEDGIATHLLTWKSVAAGAARISRACFYDRAGYGFSDPSPRPMTAINVTSDLHALLRAAGVKTPVVLVGHSLGGLYATVYADRYPKEVAGMVLIDPVFAGVGIPFAADDKRQAHVKEEAALQAQGRRCADLARTGLLTAKEPHGCYAFAAGRAPAEVAWLMLQFGKPWRYEATSSEAASGYELDPGEDEDSREETKLARQFWDMPLTVMTAGNSPFPPDMPAAEAKAREDNWRAGHDALAARSVRGLSMVVPASGHFIQIDQPQAVIDAIEDVVGRARAPREP